MKVIRAQFFFFIGWSVGFSAKVDLAEGGGGFGRKHVWFWVSVGKDMEAI